MYCKMLTRQNVTFLTAEGSATKLTGLLMYMSAVLSGYSLLWLL